MISRVSQTFGMALTLGLAGSAPLIAQTVDVTDMTGRNVSLAAPASRIASIPIPLASTIIALDGKPDRLVGMNRLARSAIAEGILGRIFPKALAIPDNIAGANFAPNVEALAAVRPDLVIQWGHRGDEIVKPITNAGLASLLVTYGDEAKGREFMRITAKAMGREDRIAAMVDWRSRVQAEMEAKSAAIPAERKPSTLYLLRFLDSIQVAGEGSAVYMDFWIKLAGGRNATNGLQGMKTVNKEQLAAWDPEVIFLNSFEPTLTVDHIYNDPILSQTRAARAKRVYKMPLGGCRWDPPNQESPLTWMWVANLLHPYIFQYDLRAEMTRAYKTLYGHDLTSAEIDEILRLSIQGKSAHYDVFRSR